MIMSEEEYQAELRHYKRMKAWSDFIFGLAIGFVGLFVFLWFWIR